jgi:glycogen operon protein
MSETIVYEMHVGGFTKHPSANVAHPGSFAGVIDKIPYLKSLGITAVELLPVFEFDETEVIRMGANGQPLYNFWGYSTVSFFAPHRDYRRPVWLLLTDFRDMVKAARRDRSHPRRRLQNTSEGNHQGPTINFRGFENRVYYHRGGGPAVPWTIRAAAARELQHPKRRDDRAWSRARDMWAVSASTGIDSRPRPERRGARAPPVIWNIEPSEALADAKIAPKRGRRRPCQIGYFPVSAGPSGTASIATISAGSSRAIRALSARSPTVPARRIYAARATCRSTASTSSTATTGSR